MKAEVYVLDPVRVIRQFVADLFQIVDPGETDKELRYAG